MIAAPDFSSARALSCWCRPAAAGNGTRIDGRPQYVISASVVAPARAQTRSARAYASPMVLMNGTTEAGMPCCAHASRIVSTSRLPVWCVTVRPISASASCGIASSTMLLRPRAPWLPPRISRCTLSVVLRRPSVPPSGAAGRVVRTGLPVSTAFGPSRRAVSSNETASARANGRSSRVVMPGAAFCSSTSSGIPRLHAAIPVGPQT